MPELRCRHRLPSPKAAGFCDIVNPETGEVVKFALDLLKEQAEAYPHLRPCPKHRGSRGTWDWTYRKYCEACPEAVHRR